MKKIWKILLLFILLILFTRLPSLKAFAQENKQENKLGKEQGRNASDSASSATSSATAPNATTKTRSGIEINPAVLEADINATEPEKKIEIELINHNSHPIILELFAINFRQGDLDGLVQFLGENSESYIYSLASFIHLPYNEVELEPNEKQSVEVIITNRQDLSPGGHYAGIIAREKLSKKPTSKTTILPAVSSLILLKKTGGEQYNLSIREVDWPHNLVEFFYPKKIHVTFQNEGNVHLVPYGRIEIRDMFNRLISKAIINPSSLYIFPSSRRRISLETEPISISLPLSFNTLTIRGQDSLKKTNFAYQETYLYVNPFAGILLILLPIILRLVSRKIKKKKHHE